MKIAAVGDLHARVVSQSNFGTLFASLKEEADILLLCGDLTAHGEPEEALKLVEELSLFDIPKVAVLGNHDFDNGHQEKIISVLQENSITVLDGDYFIYQEVGFVGIKGFVGGFKNHMLPAFGEEINKKFALEAINEAIKLENALVRVPAKDKIIMMHYAPIKETVIGEPEEIIPFMGSTHLEEPLNNFDVKAVFHGHAHSGSPEGKTFRGAPVFNVALPLLKKLHPEAPYVILNL